MKTPAAAHGRSDVTMAGLGGQLDTIHALQHLLEPGGVTLVVFGEDRVVRYDENTRLAVTSDSPVSSFSSRLYKESILN